MIQIFLFCFGLIIGSFLNVIGLRWRSGRGIGGRSFCVACYKPLRWYELIPVVSFAIQGRRCRKCSSKISWQYPLVELLTGLVFLSIFELQFSILQTLLLLAAFSIFIVVGIYDFRHKIIPDELAYSAILVGIIFRFVSGGTLLDWLTPALIFIFFALMWVFSKGRAIGFGDAKLGAAIGFLLGAAEGLSAVILAFWIGTAFAILYVVAGKMALLKDSKRLTMKTEIPLAPFLILGAWASIIWGLDLLHVTFF